MNRMCTVDSVVRCSFCELHPDDIFDFLFVSAYFIVYTDILTLSGTCYVSKAQDGLDAALKMFHGQSYRPGTDRKKKNFPLGSESIMPVLKCITG